MKARDIEQTQLHLHLLGTKIEQAKSLESLTFQIDELILQDLAGRVKELKTNAEERSTRITGLSSGSKEDQNLERTVSAVLHLQDTGPTLCRMRTDQTNLSRSSATPRVCYGPAVAVCTAWRTCTQRTEFRCWS